jgi:hypothetical protein
MFTICRTGFADFGAHFANTMMKSRAAELKISGCLAYLGTVHDKTEMIGFDMISACLKAVIHGSL